MLSHYHCLCNELKPALEIKLKLVLKPALTLVLKVQLKLTLKAVLMPRLMPMLKLWIKVMLMLRLRNEIMDTFSLHKMGVYPSIGLANKN